MQIWLLCDVPISTIIINPGYCSLGTFVQLIFFRFIGLCVANRYIFMLPGIKYILLYFIISSNYHWFRIIILCIADWILSYIYMQCGLLCGVPVHSRIIVCICVPLVSLVLSLRFIGPRAALLILIFSSSATGPTNCIAPLQASTYANCN
jgi:hypothetical protein